MSLNIYLQSLPVDELCTTETWLDSAVTVADVPKEITFPFYATAGAADEVEAWLSMLSLNICHAVTPLTLAATPPLKNVKHPFHSSYLPFSKKANFLPLPMIYKNLHANYFRRPPFLQFTGQCPTHQLTG